MSAIENVYTKDELQAAIKRKSAHIIAHGELAEKLNYALKITMIPKWKIGLLAAALSTVAAVTLTGKVPGKVGFTAAAAAATVSGLEIAVILAISFFGLALILLIARDYDESEFNAKAENATGQKGEFHMKLKTGKGRN